MEGRRESLVVYGRDKSFELFKWKGRNKELIKWNERGKGYQRWIFVSINEMEWILACLKSAQGMESFHNVIPSEEGSLRVFIVFNGENRLMVIKKEGKGRPKSIALPEGGSRDWEYVWRKIEDFLHPRQQPKAGLSYAEVVKSSKLPKGRFTLVEGGDEDLHALRVVKEDNRGRVAFLARCLVAEPNSNAGWSKLAELVQFIQATGRGTHERGWWWLDSNLVLIDCGTIKRKDEVLMDWRRKEWTKECPLQSWHPLLTHTQSKAGSERRGQFWLSMYGIPAHLWDEDLFSKLVVSFGQIVKIDRGGEAEADLGCVRLLVDCKVEDVPRCCLLKWKAFCFEVRIEVEWRSRAWLEEEVAATGDVDRSGHRSQTTPSQIPRQGTPPQLDARQDHGQVDGRALGHVLSEAVASGPNHQPQSHASLPAPTRSSGSRARGSRRRQGRGRTVVRGDAQCEVMSPSSSSHGEEPGGSRHVRPVLRPRSGPSSLRGPVDKWAKGICYFRKKKNGSAGPLRVRPIADDFLFPEIVGGLGSLGASVQEAGEERRGDLYRPGVGSQVNGASPQAVQERQLSSVMEVDEVQGRTAGVLSRMIGPMVGVVNWSVGEPSNGRNLDLPLVEERTGRLEALGEPLSLPDQRERVDAGVEDTLCFRQTTEKCLEKNERWIQEASKEWWVSSDTEADGEEKEEDDFHSTENDVSRVSETLELGGTNQGHPNDFVDSQLMAMAELLGVSWKGRKEDAKEMFTRIVERWDDLMEGVGGSEVNHS